MSVASFNRVLLTNSEFLMPFAFTLTNNKEDAKDLFQETLFRALANKDKYSIGTNIKAWLYIIMRNIFVNDYRKKIKRNILRDHSAEDLLINSTKVATINSGISSLNMKEIQKAIFKLPEVFKTPFVLYFEGFKYTEISNMLSEPLGTIKSRIHFARKLLRAQIECF